MRPLPPETFRINTSYRSRRYLLVHVADTMVKMRRTIQRTCGYSRATAAAHMVPVTGTGKYRYLVGYVFFARDHFGAGTVAHELAHAAFRLMERDGRTVDHWAGPTEVGDTEEQYADLVQHLTRSFWREAYRSGVAT